MRIAYGTGKLETGQIRIYAMLIASVRLARLPVCRFAGWPVDRLSQFDGTLNDPYKITFLGNSSGGQWKPLHLGLQCLYSVCRVIGWKWLDAYVQRFPLPPNGELLRFL